MTETTTITWECGDDGTEGTFVSSCGTFETSRDPVYGYLRLHLADDPGTSLGESASLAGLAIMADGMVASGQVTRAA